jgi:hypothetical protein
MAANPVREKRDLLFILGRPDPQNLRVRNAITGTVTVVGIGPGPNDRVTVNLPASDDGGTGLQMDLLEFAPAEWWRASPTLLTAVEAGWLYVDLDATESGISEDSISEPSLFDLFIARPPNETLGDLIAWNGDAWVRVPDGTPGQVLTSFAPGLPAWGDIALPPITGAATMVTQQSSDSSTYEVIGGLSFDASKYSTVRFETLASVTGGGLTGEIQLYNLTDAVVVTTNPYVGVTSPTKLVTGALSLPASEKIYEVRARVTGGTPPGDRVIVTHAGFEHVTT